MFSCLCECFGLLLINNWLCDSMCGNDEVIWWRQRADCIGYIMCKIMFCCRLCLWHLPPVFENVLNLPLEIIPEVLCLCMQNPNKIIGKFEFWMSYTHNANNELLGCCGFCVWWNCWTLLKLYTRSYFLWILRWLSLVDLVRTCTHTNFQGPVVLWASCQIRKIAGCACAGNAGNVFPATAG